MPSELEKAEAAWVESLSGMISEEDQCNFRAGWAAALDAAKAKMPDQAITRAGPDSRISMPREKKAEAIGWNNCLSVMDERLAALKEPTP